jgi:hypothetical protein
MKFTGMTTEQRVEYFMTENAKSLKLIKGLRERLNREIEEFNKRAVYINRNSDKTSMVIKK